MLPLSLIFTAAITLIVYSSIDVAMLARRQAINLERRSQALADAESGIFGLTHPAFAEPAGAADDFYQLQFSGPPDSLTLDCRAWQLLPVTPGDNDQTMPAMSGEIHVCCVSGEACEQGSYYYVQRLLSR